MEIAQFDRERPGGDGEAAHGFGRDRDQGAQSEQCADAGLEFGEMVGSLIDLSDEGDRHGEQRHQGRRRLSAPGDRRDAGDGDHGEQAVQQKARSPEHGGLEPHDRSEARVDHRCQFRASTQHVRLAQARAQVVARRHTFLHRCGMVAPRLLFEHLERHHAREHRADRDEHRPGRDREQDPGGPPGDSGDDEQRTREEREANQAPRAATQERADLVGVVIDPVEDLADGLLGERRERLVQHRIEQVGTQPTLRSVDGRVPCHSARRVEHRGTDEEQGEQHDLGRIGRFGEPSDDHRAERLTDRADARCRECQRRRPPGQALSVDRTF